MDRKVNTSTTNKRQPSAAKTRRLRRSRRHRLPVQSVYVRFSKTRDLCAGSRAYAVGVHVCVPCDVRDCIHVYSWTLCRCSARLACVFSRMLRPVERQQQVGLDAYVCHQFPIRLSCSAEDTREPPPSTHVSGIQSWRICRLSVVFVFDIAA